MPVRYQKIIVFSLLLIVGVFFTYKFSWSQDFTRWLSFGGAFLSFYSLSRVLIEIINWLIPSSEDLELPVVLNVRRYMYFRQYSDNLDRQVIAFLALFVVIVALGGKSFFNFMESHELTQLSKFGQIQEVVINDIQKKSRKSRRYSSYFDVSFNGEKINMFLNTKDGQEIGDTCPVIFSTENPYIIQWADDFAEKSEKQPTTTKKGSDEIY